MRAELLTVIVLEYNNGNLLYETIDSIISQSYSNIELIIAVDGDETFDDNRITNYIQNHLNGNIASYKILNSKVNRGTVKNINEAIKVSSGIYIKLIAGDDVYPNQEVFSNQIKQLTNDVHSMIVFGNTLECDSLLKVQTIKGFAPNNCMGLLQADSSVILKHIIKNAPELLATQSACFRKSFFDLFGLYDESFKLIEDLPMAVKILYNEIPFSYINYECVKHRGDVGISSSHDLFSVNYIMYYYDLKLYFSKILMPLSNIVGIRYVNIRYKICCFRIEYTLLLNNNGGRLSKMKLIIRNLVPLIYYSFLQYKRILFFLK